MTEQPFSDCELANLFQYAQGIPAEGQQFAYYCSAKTAISMLEKGTFWMRIASAMNDWSEAQHGLNIVDRMQLGEPAHTFKSALNDCHSGFFDDLVSNAVTWAPTLGQTTFITCVTEHDHKDPRETDGKLSMWRAYGAGGGGAVALLLNPQVLRDTGFAGARFRKVHYSHDLGVQQRVVEIAQRILCEAPRLRVTPREKIWVHAQYLIADLILCTKHPGFREEIEWRLIADRNFAAIKPLIEVETPRGHPEPVVKLRIASGNPPRQRAEWLDQIIIGPSPHQNQLRDALITKLTELGVHDAARRVRPSTIPYRESQ
jgi:hypothetical protein